jgi:hypothetical protein
MTMATLRGSEKQIAWAEDIRASYKAVLDLLDEAVDILSDTTQESVGGKRAYTRQLTTSHEAAASSARPWWQIDPIYDRRWEEYEAAGIAHAVRRSEREWYEETASALRAALEREGEARYWIDRRWR